MKENMRRLALQHSILQKLRLLVVLSAIVVWPLPALAEPVTVVELFSSQACPFCPKADSYFHSLTEQPGIIGLACHVSYFEVDKTSLSQPFCAERQNTYNETLRLGPNYTPQMMINGRLNVIGYKEDEVRAALAEAAKSPLISIDIKLIQNGAYQFKLPAMDVPKPAKIMVALIDRPRRIVGEDKAQTPEVYVNIVSALIPAADWDGTARTLDMKVDVRTENKGFIVLAQDSVTQEIVAAGQYLMGTGP